MYKYNVKAHSWHICTFKHIFHTSKSKVKFIKTKQPVTALKYTFPMFKYSYLKINIWCWKWGKHATSNKPHKKFEMSLNFNLHIYFHVNLLNIIINVRSTKTPSAPVWGDKLHTNDTFLTKTMRQFLSLDGYNHFGFESHCELPT